MLYSASSHRIKAGKMSLRTERDQFNDLQWKTLEYAALGLTLTQSCKKAGYADPRHQASVLRRDEKFTNELEIRLQRNIDEMKMTRDKVQTMVMEAFDLARTVEDPNAMVRAASEINKMCGFYEVEKAQIELSNSQKAFVGRLNELSDDELIAMSSQAKDINPALEMEIEAEHLEDIVDGEYTDEG